MEAEVLRIHEAYIGADGKNIIAGLNLLVGKQEILNLIGVTGSGKSTLYRYFMGQKELLRGKVIFAGQEMKTGRKFEAVRDVICLGTESTLLPKLSIAENICVITRRRKVKGIIYHRGLNNQVNFLLQQFAPELRADMKAEQLSRVQRHIVELLRAVENEAKMVYIDNAFELYGQMDLQRMSALLLQLKERGLTIIYASRRVDMLSHIAIRMIVLRKGKNVKTFYKESYTSERLKEWIAGNASLIQFQKQSNKTEVEVMRGTGICSEGLLNQVDFTVNQGEIVGLYDLNYSANLELVDILLGRAQKVAGTLLLEGTQYAPRSMEEAAKRKVGYIQHLLEGSKLTDNMTFSENLALPVMIKMSAFGLFKNQRLDRFLEQEYRQLLGIKEEDAKLPTRAFDAYVRMNIVLYKWLLAKPVLLVCEDICEETNVRMRNIVYEMLNEITKQKTGVIIASQNFAELQDICDTIYVMNSYDEETREKGIIEKITMS